MIFVTLGTQKFQLNRLLSDIDSLICKSSINEEVFAQIGNSDYIPKYFKYERFIHKDKFENYIESCSILITHCGVGTIIAGLTREKPIIVYPRLKKYNEHVDDHQLEIAESFEKLNYVLVCREESILEDLIVKSKSHIFDRYISQQANMLHTIQSFIESN